MHIKMHLPVTNDEFLVLRHIDTAYGCFILVYLISSLQATPQRPEAYSPQLT